MVGKKSKRLAILTSNLVGAPYKLGGQTVDEGLDCLSVVDYVANFWDQPLPDEFEGMTRENYKACYEADPVGAKKTFLRLVKTLGHEILPTSGAFAGDLLVIQVKGKPETIGVGIHAGNNLCLSAFELHGVALVDLRAYEILHVYRWGGV